MAKRVQHKLLLSRLASGWLLLVLMIMPGMVTTTRGASIGEEPHEAGRRIYNFRCYFCHGYSGDAQTLASRFLTPAPRNFRELDPAAISRDAMINSVREGRAGTAMKPFRNTLRSEEIEIVVDFIRREFMERDRNNTRYHTAENGWADHDRYRIAYPFATGEIALDTPWGSLTPSQRKGIQLFLSSCISCHDRSNVKNPDVLWERQALSYPRFGFEPGDFLRPPDSISAASPFAKHDVPVKVEGLSVLEREGEALYLDNCAFCHAADGSGENWIGRFLDPHPRNLSDSQAMAEMTRERLRLTLLEGVPGTSMPAWGSVLSNRQIDALIAYIARVFHPLPQE